MHSIILIELSVISLYPNEIIIIQSEIIFHHKEIFIFDYAFFDGII